MDFLYVEYDQDYSRFHGIEEWDCSWKEAVSVTSELGPLKYLILQTKVSNEF